MGAVAAIAARVLALVEASSPDALLTTAAGGMRLVDYLPTRTFELVVHTCDLAEATGQEIVIPPSAANEATRLLADLAVRTGRAGDLLLAGTGRRALPRGFTVL